MVKKKSKLIIFTACIAAFAVAVAVRGEQQTEANSNVKNQESSVSKTNIPDINKTTGARNPFQYSIPQNGFLPTSRTAVPSGIELLAIIIVRNQTPLAVLKVPGMVDVYYVKEGDSISYESKLSSTKNEIVHLRIDSINSQQIIIHPEDNLEGKRVLR